MSEQKVRCVLWEKCNVYDCEHLRPHEKRADRFTDAPCTTWESCYRENNVTKVRCTVYVKYEVEE